MEPDSLLYTGATSIINYDDPVVLEFAKKNVGQSREPIKMAVSLYYAVRDNIRYDPYTMDLSVEGLRASTTLKKRRAWCVAKAALLAACCRAFNIPARLGYADVKNHLATKKLIALMGTDIFFWHGYTAIYLNGSWVKSTPAFNIELCSRFGLKPLEFDGITDSIFHPFDMEGKKHMEYLQFRGEFPDIPMEEMKKTFEKHYNISNPIWNSSNFDREVDDEIKNTKEI